MSSRPCTDRSPNPIPLRRRARTPTPDEVDGVPWLHVLPEAERHQVVEQLQVADVQVGDVLCKHGRPATFWFGVIEGLLKLSGNSSVDAAITFSGLPPSAWFGEGTLLKHETYRCNIGAVRSSKVAGVPAATFEHLIENNIAFNHYVMNQLNERLSQSVMAREVERLTDPDARVARSLAALFHPVLHPNVGTRLRITQQELGDLVGLSRQRVNEALRALQAESLIRVEYGCIHLVDLNGLLTVRRRPDPPRAGDRSSRSSTAGKLEPDAAA